MVKVRYCFFWQSIINKTTQPPSQYRCYICESLPAVFLCEQYIQKSISPIVHDAKLSPHVTQWHDVVSFIIWHSGLDLFPLLPSCWRAPVLRAACWGRPASSRHPPDSWDSSTALRRAVCAAAECKTQTWCSWLLLVPCCRYPVRENEIKNMWFKNRPIAFFFFLHFSNLRVKWPALGSVWLESRPEAGWSAPCSRCAGRWRWWGWAWAWRRPWRSCESETCWVGWADTLRGRRAAAERKEEAGKSIEQYWLQLMFCWCVWQLDYFFMSGVPGVFTLTGSDSSSMFLVCEAVNYNY